MDGWKYVNEYGKRNRAEVKEILDRSVAGIVTFLSSPNHIESSQTKCLSMSAGIPVISSNFPLWQDLIKETIVGYVLTQVNQKNWLLLLMI